jgi:AcrR family transcriptional regulator
MTARTPTRRRGRPAAASREDVLAAATDRYLRGRRVDVQSVATELGLGRTTIYRWFGSRERLIGEVLARTGEALFAEARAGAGGRGAERILDTFDRYNRGLADAQALHSFVERERETAVRIMTSGSGVLQPRLVAMITTLIEDEVRAGDYEPPLDAATLAYAIVRLGEAFIYNEDATGMRDNADVLRKLQGAMLGVGATEGPGGARRTRK